MSEQKLKEVLKQGIYGSPEIRPDERKLFLSTIRERIYLALTNRQVRESGMYNQVLNVMKRHSDVTLYINGSLNYPAYSNYVQEANKNGVQFTIVNDGKESPIGLVLASKSAIEKEDIFITDELYEKDMSH
ncbi:YueI family protein [Alteribacter aurantiacus]|uniref:YueI family protein n=1 Tax=Alteribacter aurantiacus TaxID=254410 RepID=UPI0004236F2C|nr:YueI family protein [Alteribacter aurantiacus]